MKFIYYVASIGGPNLMTKLEILSKNLTYIHSNLKENFDIILNCYSDHDLIKKFIGSHYFLSNVYSYDKVGVLTELWMVNPSNVLLDSYDYILFMLDDVQIINLDLTKMIQIKKKYDLQIISPKVINATHYFMQNQQKNILTLNNSVEVYCLLLTPRDFKDYSLVNTVENKWMWGADMLFGHYNISAGVYYGFEVKHMLPSKSNSSEAFKLGCEYLITRGFKSYSEVEFAYPKVKKIIDNIVLD